MSPRFGDANSVRKSMFLVILMLMFSLAPVLTSPLVSSHGSSSITSWPLNGSNDTGWLTLDAVGADPDTGMSAYTDLVLEFPPGAELSNVSLGIRADGSSGLAIDEPRLFGLGSNENLLDWSGWGSFGRADNFAGNNPHVSRLAPFSDNGASWELPAGATVTDLIFETLAPLDPVVSFTPYSLEITRTAIHPEDGRMFMAISDIILQVDVNADPLVIDILDLEGADEIYDLDIDLNNDRLIVVTRDFGIHTFSLSNSANLGQMPQSPVPDDAITQVLVDGADIYAASPEGFFSLNSASTGWTMERMSDTSNWPSGEPAAMLKQGTTLYVSIWDGGVARWDLFNGQPLPVWNTANNLHSDKIHILHDTGSQLLMGSPSQGVARYNHQSSFWMATWNNGNWLSTNNIAGIVEMSGTIGILTDQSLHLYDTSVGSFSNTMTISSLGLPREGLNLIPWPSGGSRAPAADQMIVSDGSGRLAVIEPSSSPMQQDDIIIASGPSGYSMNDVIQVGNIVWVAVDEYVDRFDTSNQIWLEPVWLDEVTTTLVNDNNHVYVGTKGDGIHVLDINNASTIGGWDAGQSSNNGSLNDDVVTSLATDGNWLVAGHPDGGTSVIDLSTNSVEQTWGSDNGLENDRVNDVAILDSIAYLALDEGGIERIDLVNASRLTPWRSTGVDSVQEAPIAVAGNILYLGLYGYGVIRKNLQTGEFLDTWFGGRNGMPNSDVHALHADSNGNIWIGTQSGARVWDGQNFNNVNTQGVDGNPTVYYDFDSDSTRAYAATNAGICAFYLSSRNLDRCWDSGDDMVSNWMRAVKVNGNNLFAGSWYGANLIDLSSEEVVQSWEAGEQTGNAVTVVIGDIAYIALRNMGVARFDLTTNSWLSMWESGSGGLLDTNVVTSLAADRNPNRIWVGGSDGFQCLDWVNETEEIDIEKSSSAFSGSGDPIEIVIEGNIMYYSTYYYFGDNVHRINLDTITALSSLDAGQQAGLSGYVHGIGMVGDHLNIGVGPNWNSNSEGAVVRWNTSSSSWGTDWDVTGSVERVEMYVSSSGDTWVAWGSVYLRRYDSSGLVTGEWDDSDIEFPIREILEYDGELLFATGDGIERYDEVNGQWLSTWTPGSGMPSAAADMVMDIYVDGTDLWVGTSDTNWWGNPQNPTILKLDNTGNWDDWSGGSNGISNGFPISFERCDDYVHVAMSNNNNGGVARYNVNSGQWNSWTQSGGSLADDSPSAVVCDNQDTLYIGYFSPDQGIDRYSYSQSKFIRQIDESNNGISGDSVWWDTMAWSNGVLVIGHESGTTGNGGNSVTQYGGFSMLTASGNNAGQAGVLSIGAAVTSFFDDGGDWLIGQAGADSGYSHVDRFNYQLGLNTEFDLPGLMNGNVVEFTSNSSHVWVVTGTSQGLGSGVLQGLMLPNGSVEWEFGWSGQGGEVEEIVYHNGYVWASVNGRGIARLDPNTGGAMWMPQGLHSVVDGLVVNGDDLVVGLQGTWYSGPGVSILNTTQQQWTGGRLISGLPSNIVNDFLIDGSIAYIATEGGIGRWNLSSEEWEDSLTSLDGLPTNNIYSLNLWQEYHPLGTLSESTLYIGTSGGLARFDLLSGSALSTMTSAHGLIGTKSGAAELWSANSGSSPNLFVAHDGTGSTRPGVSELNLVGNDTVFDIHRIDQLPSNNVFALASDWWGLHIATDNEPLIHWNLTTREFEDGAASWQTMGWPISKMSSDGTNLIATSPLGLTRIDANGNGHYVLDTKMVQGATNGFISSAGIWVTTANGNGLFGWGPAPAFTEYEQFMMRRADPLSASFISSSMNVTTLTHPGMIITLVDSNNPQSVPDVGGNSGPGGINMLLMPLILSSPVAGAATYAISHGLNYSGTWWLNESDSGLDEKLQKIVDGGTLLNGSRFVTIRLQSPNNGSMDIKLTYDWVRTDSPVEITDLYDRPNDGGSTLSANWSLVHDVDFARYLLFLNEGPWTTPPTATELSTLTPDAAISIHSRTSTDIVSAGGSPLIDGVEYWAVVVVEYSDGRWGTVSQPFGPAASSDEVPASPEWGEAGPNEGGDRGELFVEWKRCDAFDLAGTNIYHSSTAITDVVGMTESFSVPTTQGNSTIIGLEAGIPYWIGLTCYDEAGQEDRMNATIIGPVVPTGGINDGIPPSRIEGVWAEDVPDDEGGRIAVGWIPSSAEDCAFYTIYIMELNVNVPVNDDGVPFNVLDFVVSQVVTDCAQNSTIISEIDGMPLVDGRAYWIGVVASDDWLNEDLGNVNIVEATPLRNLINVNIAPERIDTLNAWDLPDDDGTAIEVLWEPDESDDFDYYVVWASDSDITDLTDSDALYNPDYSICGCMKVSNQKNGDSGEALTVIMYKARYDGYEQDIVPDVELNVAITVYDIKGNVHLDGLYTVSVTPINNSLDETAPERLELILLSDYYGDAGDKLVLDFDLSDASDVDEYHIYAATWDFEGEVGIGQKGPDDFIMKLDRNPALPMVIDELFDDPLVPGLTVYVAVVVVDTSGNAHMTGLTMAAAAPIDDLGDDPGSHLPTIADLNVEWVSAGSRILVSWSPTGDSAVQSFKIYISDEQFDNVEDADLVDTVFASNSLFISAENHEGLDNETTWWVGVSASECGEGWPDCPIYRRAITPLYLSTPSSSGSTEGDSKSAEDGFSLANFATPQNLLASALGIAILLLLFVMMRGKKPKKGKSHWDLESTWGIDIQPRNEWDDDFDVLSTPKSEMRNEIMSAAQNIEQKVGSVPMPDMAAQVPIQNQPPSNLAGLTDDLLDKPVKKSGGSIDTSFLDDLL